MNILIASPYGVWCPAYEYELEIAQDHLDAGDSVSLAVCNAELPTCDANPKHRSDICVQCVGRRLYGLNRLSKPVRQIPLLSLTGSDWRQARALPQRFASVENLRKFRVDRFDLGFAALSSVVTALREPNPDLTDESVGRLLHKFIISAFAIYRSIINILNRESFDRVYVINGRLSIVRAVLRACQISEVECMIHERGHDLNHYSLHKNTIMQDLVYLERLMVETWAAADPLSREELAADYFQRRAMGEGFNWRSFVADQAVGRLPENWDPQCQNVVIFTSSDDELVALGQEWLGPVYEDQTAGIRQIAAAFAGRPNAHLYVRAHPNLCGLDNTTTRALGELGGPNVTVVAPDSKVSSYAILRNADTAIAFNSRMGAEAAFWGIPSILLGQASYRNLGSTYNPASHQELLQLLDQKLVPKDKLGALQYAYFYRTYGIRARYYEASGIFSGSYRGFELRQTGLFDEILNYIWLHPQLAQTLSNLSSAINMFRLGGHQR